MAKQGSRKPLKKSEQGKTKCVQVRNNKLCVTGHKYGFMGKLYPTSGSGGPLPVPTGRARTMKTAIKNARAFLKRVRAKSAKRR